jgi:hypothetical protein
MKSEEDIQHRLELLKNSRDKTGLYGGIYTKEVFQREIQILEWILEPTDDVLDEYYSDKHYYEEDGKVYPD